MPLIRRFCRDPREMDCRRGKAFINRNKRGGRNRGTSEQMQQLIKQQDLDRRRHTESGIRCCTALTVVTQQPPAKKRNFEEQRWGRGRGKLRRSANEFSFFLFFLLSLPTAIISAQGERGKGPSSTSASSFFSFFPLSLDRNLPTFFACFLSPPPSSRGEATLVAECHTAYSGEKAYQ